MGSQQYPRLGVNVMAPYFNRISNIVTGMYLRVSKMMYYVKRGYAFINPRNSMFLSFIVGKAKQAGLKLWRRMSS